METIKEIEFYKNGRKTPNIEQMNREYNVAEHQIFKNRHKYPDREVISFYKNENGEETYKKERIPLNRIGLPYQRKIVNVATTFLCGEPIKYTNNSADQDLYNAFIKVLDKNKIKFIDKDIVTNTGRFTECAELWYVIPEPNEYYGFKSNFRLKIKVLSPNENKLYPVFDDNDDMISFSREFTKNNITYFEVYTNSEIIKYDNKNGEWREIERIANPIGKIPIVFYKQEKVEWADVQTAIERLEQIYSYLAESNDKFAFPILKLTGKVTGQFSNDKSGRVLQLEENANADFVIPATANENLISEIDRLERDTHDFTSTPNISFDKMQGLGNMLAGSSAEFLFLSAHLKVMDKLSIYIPAFQRRASIIKSYLQLMNVSLSKQELDVEPVITPFVVNNEAEVVRFLMEANGNKPVFSQKHTMQRAGVKNPEEMIQEIEEEEMQSVEKQNSKNFF